MILKLKVGADTGGGLQNGNLPGTYLLYGFTCLPLKRWFNPNAPLGTES
jgi:hypothetical protein